MSHGEARATIEISPGALIISAPVPRRNGLFHTAVNVISLYFCGSLALDDIIDLFSADTPAFIGLFSWFLIFLSLASCIECFWGVLGRETLIIQGEKLTLKRSALIYSSSKDFNLQDVSNVRSANFGLVIVRKWTSLTHWAKGPFARRDRGSIEMDIGTRTYAFGQYLEETEACELAEAIVTHYPSLTLKTT